KRTGSGVRELLQQPVRTGPGASRPGDAGTGAAPDGGLRAVGRGAGGSRVGTAERGLGRGTEGAQLEAGGSPHSAVPLLGSVPAGAAAAGRDRHAEATNDPDAGARAVGRAGGARCRALAAP